MSSLANLVISNPIASLGLLSLLIPILVHLFNPNRGKTIFIGNLHLISKVKNSKVTEIKIRQWLLLFTRLVFLTILTLLLMELLFPKKIQFENKQSIFVTNAWLSRATESEKDKFRKQHKEHSAYLMQPGLDKIKEFSDIKGEPYHNYSLDSLISEAISAQLFTSKNVIYFDPKSDFVNEKRSLQTVSVQNDLALHWVKLESSVSAEHKQRVTVFYSADRIHDFKTLKVALDTLKQGNSSLTVDYYPISEQEANPIQNRLQLDIQEPPSSDWYFWLSSEAIPEAIRHESERGSFVLNDSQNNLTLDEVKIVSINGVEFNLFHQLPKISELQSITTWNYRDSSLLSYQPIGKGKQFQFHSRFNENWNNISSGTTLLELMVKLINLKPAMNTLQDSDLFINDLNSQLINNVAAHNYQPYRDLIILVLVIFWLLERLLSESKAYRHD